MYNFTKEYIKECDCGEIQNMKNNLERDGKYMLQFNEGDWLQNRDSKKIHVAYQMVWENRQFYIWLPTGDQLDNEIVRGCRKLYKYFSYQVNFEEDGSCSVWLINCRKKNLDDKGIGEYFFNSNPLIAKIKLLKALLKEDK